MAFDSTKPVVVVPYIDPHTNDRMPNIILSRFHVVGEPRAGLISSLIDHCEMLDKQFDRIGMDSKKAMFGNKHGDEIDELIKTIIEDPKAMEFICNVVIPAKHGHMISEIRDLIPELLQDPTMWDFYEPFASRKNDTDNIDFFHVDSSSHSGELRIGFSPQLSTRFRVGWHQVSTEFTGAYPLKDANGQNLTQEEQPLPLTFVLWEASSGVHDIPLMDQTTLEAIGGQRDFGSLTVNFDRVVERAKQMLHEKNAYYLSSLADSSDDIAPPVVIDER